MILLSISCLGFLILVYYLFQLAGNFEQEIASYREKERELIVLEDNIRDFYRSNLSVELDAFRRRLSHQETGYPFGAMREVALILRREGLEPDLALTTTRETGRPTRGRQESGDSAGAEITVGNLNLRSTSFSVEFRTEYDKLFTVFDRIAESNTLMEVTSLSLTPDPSFPQLMRVSLAITTYLRPED